MSQGIVYQNKDIEFKVLSEVFKEKSFEAYGLDLPRIKAVLPTNLPAVSANELRMDNLFLLEDGTYAIVDYESTDNVKNRIKYINYISRIVKRLYEDHGEIPKVRMIVIYTGDIVAAKSGFDVGCMALQMEQVFVSDIPAEEIYRTVRNKLLNGIGLTEQELMQLIILPLAGKDQSDRQKWVRDVVFLAQKMQDEQEQKFVLAGLLVVSDKFIKKEDAEAIRRDISMTKVGRMIFEDGHREGIKEGKKEGKKEERIVSITNLLKLNIEEDIILGMYSETDLKEAKAHMSK